jgi:hypothetical protein
MMSFRLYNNILLCLIAGLLLNASTAFGFENISWIKGYLITPKPQPSLKDDQALVVSARLHSLVEGSYLPV